MLESPVCVSSGVLDDEFHWEPVGVVSGSIKRAERKGNMGAAPGVEGDVTSDWLIRPRLSYRERLRMTSAL